MPMMAGTLAKVGIPETVAAINGRFKAGILKNRL